MPLNPITIAVDAMGGDHGPPVIIPAVLQILEEQPSLNLILVGNQDRIQTEINKHPGFKAALDRLTVRHTSEEVAMDESPAIALRTKKNSSMRVAINLVKDGTANACVSAGNTGALMATARFVLKTISGIDRPAIISTLPTMKPNKHMRMLDLGANIDTPAHLLFQFAVMGSVLAQALDNNASPKIYLLNIGVEDIKGNDQVKQAAQLLSQSTLNYRGYIEGDEIYKGDAEIVVCDGFVGNVALKTTEGVAIFIGKLLKRAFYKNIFTKLSALIAMPALKSLAKSIDPDRYNGATLIGLKGIVIKSHGSANIRAYKRAIEEAIHQAEKNIPELISAEVEKILKHTPQSQLGE
jgi:glycerol-3-phosphate acyltransferase PlsX